ncbi:MAG: hypothetical protein M3O50_09670 [Myxococcota bacterium]|nr:hypothetical protein [Myxococcota bacterium]
MQAVVEGESVLAPNMPVLAQHVARRVDHPDDAPQAALGRTDRPFLRAGVRRRALASLAGGLLDA